MLEAGKIIFTGKSKQNHSITVRYPDMQDAKSMWKYINTLSKEKTFIRFQGEEISLEEERKYLVGQLEKISQKTTVLLLAFCNMELIGIAGIDMFDKTEHHVGEFGISISKHFRGEGIGSLLMELTIDEAKKNFPLLEIVTLWVFSNNKVGLEMYRKYGFLEHGNLPGGIKLEGMYVDKVYMHKRIATLHRLLPASQ